MNGNNDEAAECLRQVYRALNETQRETGQHFSELGFEVVEVSGLILPERVNVNAALPYGFNDALYRFLTSLGDQVAVGSLEEISALNRKDMAHRAPYGQDYLEGSQKSPLSEEDYLALKEHHQSTPRDGLSSLFADFDIDVLLSDVGQAYAPAGFPAMTVPAGYNEAGQPFGVNMIANYLGEPSLIAVGYAFEQAMQARVEPDLRKTIQQIEAIPGEH